MTTLAETIKTSGGPGYQGPKKKTYKGKSMKLGHGGRAAKLKDELKAKNPKMPDSEVGGIIGDIARSKGAAPGQRNYHGGRK